VAGSDFIRASCRDVGKDYRVGREIIPALEAVDCDVRAGSLTVIAGPSGSGKSSLLRILACVDRPSRGRVEIGSTSVGDASRRSRQRLRRRAVGYIFQDPVDNLVEYLTVAEQLVLAAQLRGSCLSQSDIDRLLETMRLSHRRDHRPARLSGGEQQRVAVATSIVGSPMLVVTDEPTAELDSTAAAAVLDAMVILCGAGATFVVASHDSRVIERADRLVRLEYGRVTESW